MNIFEYNGEEFDKKLNEFLNKYDEEKLINELILSGLNCDFSERNLYNEYHYTIDIVCDFSLHKKTSSFWDKILPNKKEKEVIAA